MEQQLLVSPNFIDLDDEPTRVLVAGNNPILMGKVYCAFDDAENYTVDVAFDGIDIKERISDKKVHCLLLMDDFSEHEKLYKLIDTISKSKKSLPIILLRNGQNLGEIHPKVANTVDYKMVDYDILDRIVQNSIYQKTYEE